MLGPGRSGKDDILEGITLHPWRDSPQLPSSMTRLSLEDIPLGCRRVSEPMDGGDVRTEGLDDDIE